MQYQEEKKTQYNLSNVGNCPRCRRLLSARAGVSLLLHFIDEHGLDEDSAADTLARVYRRILDGSHNHGR